MNKYDAEKIDSCWGTDGSEIELQKYKDLEEKLGIDLITLFKALKQGRIWVKNTYGKLECVCDYSLNFNAALNYWFLRIGEGLYDVVGFKEYGKTWALTKEELE